MATLTKCPVCEKNTAQKNHRDGENDLNSVKCTNCGTFQITGSAAAVLSSGWLGHSQLLAHAIRKRSGGNHPFVVNTNFLTLIKDTQRFPDAHQQADNLLIALGDHLPHPGQRITISPDKFQASVGAATPESFEWLLEEFLQAKIVTGSRHKTLSDPLILVDTTLTLEGWQKYSELKQSDKQSRLAFMAMPFKCPELTRAFEECFKPATASTGFELRRVIDSQGAGLIDDQIRVGIRRSRLVICELAGHNQGAYWEAGFAEGIGIPVIYTCREDEFSKIHFDTSHLVTVRWSPSNLGEAAKRLTATIRATLPMEAKMDDEP